MRIRPLQVENFEKEDLFNDTPLCERLAALAKNIEHGMVVSLNSDWGNGKTTFVRRWRWYMREQKFLAKGEATSEKSPVVVYIDAFEKDYMESPFIVISSQITSVINGDKSDYIGAAARIAAPVVKAVAKLTPAAPFIDLGDSVIQSFKNMYAQDRDDVKAFKDEFRKIAKNTREETGYPLIVILDEIDRCKPDFAVALLESIKHFFDVNDAFFVLSVNLQQLENSINGVYGDRFDANQYISKFIDYGVMLDRRSAAEEYKDSALQRYIPHIMKQYGIVDTASEYGLYWLEAASIVLSTGDVSLRDAEKIIYLTGLSLSLKIVHPYYVDKIGIALILIMTYAKIKNAVFFEKIMHEEATYAEFSKEFPQCIRASWRENYDALFRFAFSTEKELAGYTEDTKKYVTEIARHFRVPTGREFMATLALGISQMLPKE